MKRIFDLLVGTMALLLTSPLLLLTALMIKLSSPGPVFFTQRRLGRYQVPFNIVKFRSMSQVPDASAGRFDAGDTSRVTPVGSFIRKTKIDELPQLINVLRGEMSLVGPRPEIQKWVDAYPEQWAQVLQVRPGITDPASIVYRHEEKLLSAAKDPELAYRDEILPRKLELYLLYIANRSFIGDTIIILKTVITLGKSS